MKPVVERFEILKNQFSKWVYALFTALALLALVITWNKADNKKWIMFGGVLLFSSGWWMAVRHKISVDEKGFDVQYFNRSKHFSWEEVQVLSFDVVYNGHSAEARLKIQAPGKTVLLPVKQYQRQPMQRFFQVLLEQCANATKNEHFIRQASGTMDWKSRIKMY